MKTISVASGSQPLLRIQLLGAFGIWVNGEAVAEDQLHSRRACNLIKLLALTPGHRLHRDKIIDTLWPDSDLGAAANNFHQTLHATRKVLCPAGEGCLVLEDGFLDLRHGSQDKLDVDVDRFEAAAAALSGKEHPPEDYQVVLSLYSGDLLPENPYEEWTITKREALRGMYQGLLLGQSAAYELRQEYPAGIEALRKLLESDPSSEDAHAALMRLLAKSGQRRAALRQYETLKERLSKELDVEPSQSTFELYQAIHSGKLTPLPEVIVIPGHNLPAETTSFIGREQEIETLKQLILSGKTRLVTVSGAGGVGKTRLALRVAEELLEAFSGKVRYMDLVRATDPDLVAGAALKVMGLRESPHQPPAETLVEFLREMRYLLVLDNCEHVIQAVAELAEALLRGCPRVVILTTSRELLKVSGETAYRCPSLSLPEEPQPGLLEPAPKPAAECESVRLFAERAAQSLPGFTLNERNLPPVEQICLRLDGIPLAIEMAAARLRVLSVVQIAGRLDQIFLMLNGGLRRTELPRHQTLKAAIDWSYGLLADAEKALLGRLAVFVGGWTLDAAEAIFSDEDKLKQADILDLIGQLVDKSLVLYEQEKDLDPRYRMLEPVRQYAHDRLLESGDEPELRQRHLEYFTALAEEAEPHLRAWGMVEWLARLEQELGNLRLALEWAMPHSAEHGLRLAAALKHYWHTRVHELEGISWLMRFLAEDDKKYSQQPRSLDALLLYSKGLLAASYLKCQSTVLQFEEGGALSELSAKLLREAGQTEALSTRYSQAGKAQGIDEVLDILSEVYQGARNCGDKFMMGECLMNLIQIHLSSGNIGQAKGQAEENLAIHRETGDIDGEAFALYLLATVATWEGNLEQAEEFNRASQAGFLAIGNYQYYYLVLIQNAFLDELRGNYTEERHFAEMMWPNGKIMGHSVLIASIDALFWSNCCLKDIKQCERWRQEIQKYPPSESTDMFYQGMIHYLRGDYRQAASTLKKIPFIGPGKFMHLQTLGVIAAALGQNRRAGVLFGALDRACPWRNNGIPPILVADFKEALQSARAALGEAEFQAAWEEGRAMSLDQMLAYAVEDRD